MRELLYSSEKPYVRAYKVTFPDQGKEWYKVILGRGDYRRIIDKLGKEDYEHFMDEVFDRAKGESELFLDGTYWPSYGHPTGMTRYRYARDISDKGIYWTPTVIKEELGQRSSLGRFSPLSGRIIYRGPEGVSTAILAHEWAHKKGFDRLDYSPVPEYAQYVSEKQCWVEAKRRLKETGDWTKEMDEEAAWGLSSYDPDYRVSRTQRYQTALDWLRSI